MRPRCECWVRISITFLGWELADVNRSIMCSYNALNGVPTCADSYILQTILREHWGWTDDDQYVTSDCDAVQNIFLPHGYASTREEAVADALKAGTDLDCGTYYPLHLPSAYSDGLFDESVIDKAVMRLYSALIKLGYFDSASATPYRSLGFKDVSTPAAEALALKAAEEGIVLLKNDGTLPLSLPTDKITTIAMIGGLANSTTQMQGNYYGIARYLHSPLYAAEQLPNVQVLYAPGVGGQGDPTTDDWQFTLAAAEAADIVRTPSDTHPSPFPYLPDISWLSTKSVTHVLYVGSTCSNTDYGRISSVLLIFFDGVCL